MRGEQSATVEITARVLLAAYDVDPLISQTIRQTIVWMTNGLSNSSVEYGLGTAYGSNINYTRMMVFSHTITLVNLSDSELYHYRVVSFDSGGNNCTSEDFTFTT